VVTDENLAAKQGAALTAMFGAAPELAVAPGEGAKSLEGLGRVLAFLAENKLDRGGVVFAVGGGVVGDLAGSAAAAWLRGVEFQQVPTHIAGDGGQLGGREDGDQYRGGEKPRGRVSPAAGGVYSTGSADDVAGAGVRGGHGGSDQIRAARRRGVAGATGAGAVDGEERGTGGGDSPVLRRCKAGIVQADERETAKEGGRALLNLGHTFGHAIENIAGYGEYLHGEAVAIGLSAAARLSQKLGLIGEAEVARVDAVVAAHGLPTRLRAPLAVGALREAMARDKKVRAGGLRFVVLKSLGEAATQGGIDPALADASFREVGAV